MPARARLRLQYYDYTSAAAPTSSVVGAFRGRASRIVGRPLWQRGYHDRVIRNEDELQGIREYIETNPLRWALDRENPERVPITGAGPVRPHRREATNVSRKLW